MLQPSARRFTCRLAAQKQPATAIAKPARRCSTFFPSGSRFTLITVANCSARRLMKWKSKGQRPEQGQTMKRFLAMLMSAGALGLLVFAQTPAQELKHFSAKGLSFDYPAPIELDDRSNPNGQHLVIQGKDTAQIMVVCRFVQITSAEVLVA